MKKKAEKGPGTQGGNAPDTELATALAPLVAQMTTIRASLLDWVHGRGVDPGVGRPGTNRTA